MLSRLRELSTSLDVWVAENRRLSTTLGTVLVAAAAIVIVLDAIDGPLQWVTYLVMGLGVALILVPRNTPKNPDKDA